MSGRLATTTFVQASITGVKTRSISFFVLPSVKAIVYGFSSAGSTENADGIS